MTTETKTLFQNTLDNLNASITLINSLVTKGVRSDEIIARVSDNARHLQLIIDGEEFKASKTDAKPYTDAITEGLAFIKGVAVPVTPPVVPTTPPKTSKK